MQSLMGVMRELRCSKVLRSAGRDVMSQMGVAMFTPKVEISDEFL